LHKGTNEIRDNGLVVRLVTPGGNLLLLGAAAQSKYVLAGLLASVPLNYLQASLVQMIGEVDKQFPVELAEVLQVAHPSFMVITPGLLNAKLRKSGATSVIALPPSLSSSTGNVPHLQIVQTAQVGTIELMSSNGSWDVAMP